MADFICKRINATVLVILYLTMWAASNSFAQSQLDSLEIYSPFNNVEEIRNIIRKNFFILGPSNKILVEKYRQEISFAEKNKIFPPILEKLIKIGDIYYASGIYSLALDSYYKALKIYENNSDSLNAALIKLKLGRTYYYADLAPSEDFYLAAYKILKASKKKNHVALTYYISGFLKKHQKEKDYFNRKALEIQREVVKDSPKDVKAKETLASILNANYQYEEAISIASEIGNNFLLMLYLNNYGYLKVVENKYDEAFSIFQRSLKICKNEKNKTVMRNIYENIGRIYRLKGNWLKAYQYQLLAHFFEESLFTEKFSLLASDYKIKYDLERKEYENTLLAEKIGTQKKLNLVLIFSISAISIVLLLVFLSKRKLKTANTLLDKRNLEILSQKSELEEINRALHESEYNLKEAQATAKLANWELDLGNGRLQFSDQFVRMFGTDSNLGENNFQQVLDQLIHSEDKVAVRNFFFGNDYEAAKEEIEFGITKNNITKWIKAYKVSLFDERNKKIRSFGTLQDITELKEKEKIKIEMAAQESFAKQLIQSQETDRKRIAGELHDGLGQEILLIKNRALLGLQNPSIDSNSLLQLNEINQSATSVLNMVREISFNLRPAHLERLGLTETIAIAIKKIEKTTAVQISLKIDNIDNMLGSENEINLFRIIQEGLNNILKHSNAKKALIEITKNSDQIHITIQDDGKGFDFKTSLKDSPGFGFKNIYNRVHILNGDIKINSAYLEGTRLVISVPIQTDE